MTRVRYDRAGLRMRMEGHAGAGEYGRDIVCAAESILLLVLERQLQELLLKATDQNFVPVVDDKGAFIGIVTRRAIMRYCLEQYIAPQLAEAR